MIAEEVRKKIWKVAFPLLAIAVACFVKRIPFYIWGHHIEFDPSMSAPMPLYYKLILGVLIAPIFEEALFRGPIYVLVKSKVHILLLLVAIVFWSGAMFGFSHLTNFEEALPSFWPYYVLILGLHGLVYGLLVLITKSIWPSVVLHMLANGNLFVYYYIAN